MSNINHPTHYSQSNIGCIDALQSCLSPEEFKGFCLGNPLRYLWRHNQKGGIEDLKKLNGIWITT